MTNTSDRFGFVVAASVERRQLERRERETWDKLTTALKALDLKVKRERDDARRIKEIDGVEFTYLWPAVSVYWQIPKARGLRIVVRPPRPARPLQFREPKDGFDFERIAVAIAEAVISTRGAHAVRNAAIVREKANERALRQLRRRAPELASILDGAVSTEADGFTVSTRPISVQAVERIARVLFEEQKNEALSVASTMRKNR
jgi:hypothetical protein